MKYFAPAAVPNSTPYSYFFRTNTNLRRMSRCLGENLIRLSDIPFSILCLQVGGSMYRRRAFYSPTSAAAVNSMSSHKKPFWYLYPPIIQQTVRTWHVRYTSVDLLLKNSTIHTEYVCLPAASSRLK